MATVSTVVGNPHYINFEEFCNLLAKINNADSGPSEAEVLQEMFTVRACVVGGRRRREKGMRRAARLGVRLPQHARAPPRSLSTQMFDTDCDGFLTLSDLRAIFAKASIESMGLVTVSARRGVGLGGGCAVGGRP